MGYIGKNQVNEKKTRLLGVYQLLKGNHPSELHGITKMPFFN
jgi:hypothetical protein